MSLETRIDFPTPWCLHCNKQVLGFNVTYSQSKGTFMCEAICHGDIERTEISMEICANGFHKELYAYAFRSEKQKPREQIKASFDAFAAVTSEITKRILSDFAWKQEQKAPETNKPKTMPETIIVITDIFEDKSQ